MYMWHPRHVYIICHQALRPQYFSTLIQGEIKLIFKEVYQPGKRFKGQREFIS